MLDRTCYCGEITEQMIGQSVNLYGWVQRQRDLGGLIFIDLRDRSGIIQLQFDESVNKAAFDVAFGVRSEFVLKAVGRVARRGGAVNTELATYGDALLKFTLCELFLDRVNKLSAVKQNYESDVALVGVAERYDLLRYLHFDRADRRIPQDYEVRPVPLDCPPDEERRLRADNEKHKYIATAVEALLGAMYHAHADMDEIRARYLLVNRKVQEEVPMASMYIISTIGVTSDRLTGAAPDVFGTFINVHEWDIDG